MESGMKELICYRMERAEEMLAASETNLKAEQYRTSLNRSYYAVFHAMRAMNLLDGFDSSKHSGVIAHFNKFFLKEEKLDKALAKVIKDTSYLREKSDYDDFYIASRKEAVTQLENARRFVGAASTYLKKVFSDGGF